MKFEEAVKEYLVEEDATELFDEADDLIKDDLDAIYDNNKERDFEDWGDKYGDDDTFDDMIHLLLYIGLYKEQEDGEDAPVVKAAIDGIPKIVKSQHGEYVIVNDKPINELFKLLKKNGLTKTNIYKYKDDILK